MRPSRRGRDDRSGTADFIDDIEQARERIAGTVLRTPLVKLDLGDGSPDIRLKLENLQPTNAYKIRGGANAVARLSDEAARPRRVDDQRGQCGTGRRLCGARIRHPLHRRRDRDRAADQARPHARAWRDHRAGLLRRCLGRGRDASFPGLDSTFVHPFDNHDFIAGHGTMGLEILEDCPRYEP